MKRFVKPIALSLLAAALLIGLMPGGLVSADGPHLSHGKIVVANRASGDISVIDAQSGALIANVGLPAGDFTPEPMYVVYTLARDRVFVGDRANNRVVVFDARDFSVEATVPAGAGVFHMWADGLSRQLWVNNDIDNTSTVINPRTLKVITTVATPADLVAQGGRPHDVILDPLGRFAYVTVVGLPGVNDYVVQYSTRTFEEVKRAPVGKDPHVSLTWRNSLLYVPSQNSNVVNVLNRRTLEAVTDIVVPGAHGAGMTLNGRVLYTTNLPGGGDDALWAIDTRSNAVIGEPVDTPYAVPHNIALTPTGRMLFLTHSGALSDKVTFYTTTRQDPTPVFAGEVTVGLNPFGLAYVP